jgi:acetyltransferase-like isoleucine patch superfamily enzyme
MSSGFLFRASPFFAGCYRGMLFRIGAWLGRKWGIGGRIGSGSVISRCSRIDYPWKVAIATGTFIGNESWLYAMAPITIGNNVCISEKVSLLTGTHDVSSSSFDLITKPIVIKDNVWIATGAMVLPGVTIGEGAVVAAGAVVTKDVEPWTVVGGNPAKVIKKRELVG